MRITLQDGPRLLWVASESPVVAIPMLGLMAGQRATYVEPLMPAFLLAWPILLGTSLVLLRFERLRAIVGLVTCLIGFLWGLSPVLVV